MSSEEKTCLDCPFALLKAIINLRSCCQSTEELREKIGEGKILIECIKRPDIGFFEPTLDMKECPESPSQPF